MKSRFDILCEIMQIILKMDIVEIRNICARTETGKLAIAENEAIMSESFANNIEGLLEDLENDSIYNGLVKDIEINCVFEAVRTVSKRLFINEKEDRKISVSIYIKEPVSPARIADYYLKLYEKNRKILEKRRQANEYIYER